MRYEYKNGEKLTRFSIRKYHFGAASVAVASLIFCGGGMSAKAENVPVSHDTQNSGNDTSAGGDSGKQATADSKPITVDVPKAALPTAKVDKADLNKLTINLDTLVRATEKEKISSISKELNKVLADAKELLEKENATAEEVKTQVEELKKATEKLNATVAEADKKAEEQKKAEEAKKAQEANQSGTDRSVTEEASNRAANVENTTPKKRGKKRGTTEVQPADSESTTPKVEAATSNKEAAPKALPTYTNGAGDTGTYALAEEMRNIVTYLRKNGADAAKVDAIKANYDKLNEKLGLTDENAVLSEEDFKKALADLKQARDFTEGFLANKDNGGRTELPKPEAILNRQTRQAGKSFADSIEYFIDDGKQETPYSKYTYVFHTMKQSGVNDWGRNEKVSNGQRFIHARTVQNREGFSWDILVNEGGFNNYSTNSFWFTIPNGQNYVNNSVEVTKVSTGEKFTGSTIESALQAAGLGRVTKGTPANSGVFRSGMGAGPEAYRTGSLNDLARESVDTLIDKGLYRRAYETAADQKESNEKFDRIVNSGGSLYYFEIPERTGDSYRITFRTKGNNLPKNLVYAV